MSGWNLRLRLAGYGVVLAMAGCGTPPEAPDPIGDDLQAALDGATEDAPTGGRDVAVVDASPDAQFDAGLDASIPDAPPPADAAADAGSRPADGGTDATPPFRFKAACYAGGGNDLIIRTGDLNGDQFPDVVTSSWHKTGTSIFLNRGDGTLGPPTMLPMTNLVDLQLMDVDRDGRLDLVNGIVYYNQGGGKFAPPVPGWSQFVSGFRIASADFNGDGWPDFATFKEMDGTLQVVLNRGPKQFELLPSVDLVRGTSAVAVGDLDGDGDLDMSIVHQVKTSQAPNGPDLICKSNLINDGTGRMKQLVTHHSIACYRAEVALADLDGDAIVDRIFSFSIPNAGSALSVIFTKPNVKPFGYDQNSVDGVAAGDFNRDGILDLLAQGETELFIFPGKGGGSFAAPMGVPFATFYAVFHALEVTDMNRDGKLDIVTLGCPMGGVGVLLNETP